MSLNFLIRGLRRIFSSPHRQSRRLGSGNIASAQLHPVGRQPEAMESRLMLSFTAPIQDAIQDKFPEFAEQVANIVVTNKSGPLSPDVDTELQWVADLSKRWPYGPDFIRSLGLYEQAILDGEHADLFYINDDKIYLKAGVDLSGFAGELLDLTVQVGNAPAVSLLEVISDEEPVGVLVGTDADVPLVFHGNDLHVESQNGQVIVRDGEQTLLDLPLLDVGTITLAGGGG